MDRQRIGIGIVLALVGAVVLAVRAASRGSTDTSGPIDEIDDDGGLLIPAAMADSEGALPLRIRASATPSGKRLALEVGDGAAVLTIQDPRKREFGGFGKCTLEAPDREKGAAFVRAVARWLGQPDGAGRRPVQPLAPVPCTYAMLGDGRDPSGRSWLVRKLFFETRRDTAEVYLRVSRDETRAELLEKDEDYRAPLVDALGVALRDGPTPRRTTSTDPNLAADAPLVATLTPLGGDGARLAATAWAGGKLLGAAREGKKSVIRVWERLDQPPRDVARLEGYAQSLHVDPKATRVAVLVVYPRHEDSVASDDPGGAALVELATGRTVPVLAGDPGIRLGMLTTVTWAPRGDALVLEGEAPAPDGGRAGSIAVVVDASGQRLDATSPPRPAAPPKTEVVSPDGRYRLRVEGAALVVTGGAGERRFTSAREEDRDAFESVKEGDASWIGGAGLLLQSDDLLLLDLDSMKLRLLLPPGDLRFETASPDGKIVLVKKDDAALMWGAPGR